MTPAAPILRRLIEAAGRENGTGPLEVAVRHLEKTGFRVDEAPGGGAVVARRGDPRLLLSGHVDVVPAGEGWRLPPFEGREEAGRIWGRGACDMLGSVSAFLAVAQTHPDLPLGVALTTDEETGMRGAQRLASSGLLAGFGACVVAEPTDFEVGIAEKGVLWVRLVARGRSAHASMPEKGENAIDKLWGALSGVQGLDLGGEHPRLGRATRSVGVIRGGTQVNVVPERCECEVDFRYLPGLFEGDLLARIRAAAGSGVEAEVLSAHPPFEAREGSRLRAELAGAAQAETGARPREVGLPYGTEASRFLDLDFDLVIFGPGERALAHTNGESIRLADLDAATRIFTRLAKAYARG